MTLLRRVLTAGALVSLLAAVPLVVAPGAILEGLLDQAPLVDAVWVRLYGLALVVLALVQVLVLRKLDDLWWWCWIFVLFDGVATLIFVLHAATSVPEGSAAWPWWISGAVSALFAALTLTGIARAGQEKPLI